MADYLSALAQALLREICRIAISESVRGENLDQQRRLIENDFAIIAYGKLGSRELGFGSDLDLVFIFDDSQKGMPDLGRFLTRYAQKVIHLLSVRTYSGILYEVDMRLRPSGKSGPLVSSLTAFGKYQREGAWTWEHQALVKAQVVVIVPKRSINKAHKRNKIKRLCREAYRLNKHLFLDTIPNDGKTYSLALLYLPKDVLTFIQTDKAIKNLFNQFKDDLQKNNS